MKIFKNGFIYDTENPDQIEPFRGTEEERQAIVKPENWLHRPENRPNGHYHETDKEFMLHFFPQGHEIFDNLSESTYFAIK